MKGWFDAFRADGGPTLYTQNNRTSVHGDMAMILISIVFLTVLVAFLLIFPGVRSQPCAVAMVPPSQLFVRTGDGKPMEFHLEAGLPRPERCRLQALVVGHGGALVVNPARCPHAVTLGAGAPGSQPRSAVSDRPDTFSVKFVDECVRQGRVVDLCPFRLQPSSLYSQPGRVNDVLLGRSAWSDLAVVTALPESDSDDELRLLAAAGEPGRGARPLRHGRLRYSREKDEALVRFVAEHGSQYYTPPTAPKFWQEWASRLPALLADHPPLSLHNRFLKQVRPRLSSFRSTIPLYEVARVADLSATWIPLTEEQRRAVNVREAKRYRRLLAIADALYGCKRDSDDSDTDAEDLVGVTDPGNEASRGAAAPVASADTPAEGTAPAADEAPLAHATATADTAAESAELDTGAGDASMEPAGASGAASVSPERAVVAMASGAGRRGRGTRRLYTEPLVPEVYPDRVAPGRQPLRSASRSRSSVSSSDNFQSPPGKVTLPAGERSSRPGPSGVRPARRSRRLSSSADSGASADTPQSARSSRRLSSDAGADTTQSARRQWQAYSRPEEDLLVRRVLAEHAAGGLLGGRRLWERIQDSGVLPGRSWQSLKERWRRMAPRLRNNRRLTESQRRQLSRALRRPTGRPSGGRPPNEPHSPARPYTRAEDLAVLRFLREEPGRVVNISGRALWQDMSVALNRSGRSVRSWQSLKERFHKRIAPALHHEYNEVDSVFRVFLAAELGL